MNHIREREDAGWPAPPVQTRKDGGSAETNHALTELQRSAGNAAVASLVEATTGSRSLLRAPAAAVTADPPLPSSGGTVRLQTGLAPQTPDEINANMASQVDMLAAEWRHRFDGLKHWQVGEVVSLIREYAQLGKDEARGTDRSPSTYVDKLITLMLIKAYDRGVLITDYSNLFDDALENAGQDQIDEIDKCLREAGSQYTGYRPGDDPDRASFLKEVADPVFFRATALLSFGIVDKELFQEANDHVMKDGYAGFLAYLTPKIGRSVLDFFTIGAGSAYLTAIYKDAKENPNAPYLDHVAAGVTAAWDAVAPVDELMTIVYWARGKSLKPGEAPPDKWKAMEAFFSGMMKVVALIGAAKGIHEENEKANAKSSTGKDLHGQPKAGEKGSDPVPGIEVGDPARTIREKVAGKWKDFVKGKSQAELDSIEAAREKLRQEIGLGERTGRKPGALSDMDITVGSYAEARQWMAKAVEKLFNEKFDDLPPDQQRARAQQVQDMLDVNVSTDAGRVTAFDSASLPAKASAAIEKAAFQASENMRLRLLKGQAEKGNPVAREQLAKAAQEAGVKVADIEPLDRVPEGQLDPVTKARIDELKAESDRLAAEMAKTPSEATGKKLVEVQTELLALDPEAYFDPGAVKGEVSMRDPKASSATGAGRESLTPRQALGNIRNNFLNAINELTKALSKTGGSEEDAYAEAGKSSSFSKYVWRVLRTAKLMGAEVDDALLDQSKRIYETKDPSADLPTDTAKADYAKKCFAALAGAESAAKIRGIGPDYSGLVAAAGATAGRIDDREFLELFGPDDDTAGSP